MTGGSTDILDTILALNSSGPVSGRASKPNSIFHTFLETDLVIAV